NTTLRPIDNPSQRRPHLRVADGRIGHATAGIHFIQVASAQSAPPSRGPVNWAAHSINVSSRLILPVSRLAPTGKARTKIITAVRSGRRRYAQSTVHSSSRIVPTRQTTQATSHGSSAHGANNGSIHGA